MAEDEEEVAIVRCGTSAGPITLKFLREWSPHGYDRAVELFERGFYDNTHFFRVVPGFIVQFGITYSTDEELKSFAGNNILDDPQLDPPIAFREGIISFAGYGDNSRTSQLFIAQNGDAFGTQKWETPVGEVVEGLDDVARFYSYGDMPPWGEGPEQEPIFHDGPAYIEKNFPKLDHFTTCKVQRKKNEASEPRILEEPETASLEGQEKFYIAFGAVVLVVSFAAIAMLGLGRNKKGTKLS